MNILEVALFIIGVVGVVGLGRRKVNSPDATHPPQQHFELITIKLQLDFTARVDTITRSNLRGDDDSRHR